MKQILYIFLLGFIFTLPFAYRESYGLKNDSSTVHWTDSEPKNGWSLGESPDAGIFSPGPQWNTTLTDVPTLVAYHAAVAMELTPGDWRVYVFGGFDGTDFLATTYEYDPQGDTVGGIPWSTKASMPGGPRGRIARSLLHRSRTRSLHSA